MSTGKEIGLALAVIALITMIALGPTGLGKIVDWFSGLFRHKP